jgi:GlcNAc-P-P-Und epimerase
MQLLITGGSGFIGTNCVHWFLERGHSVLNIDLDEPVDPSLKKCFQKADLLDAPSLQRVISKFEPTHVLHLAAETSLGRQDYSSNTVGVRNLIEALRSIPKLQRTIFTSTQLVCPLGYQPKRDDEYLPDTAYGESKVEGEMLVRQLFDANDWVIVRPTSIWGPWSMSPHIPYGRFIVMVARGLYFHPGGNDPPRSFGYVDNVAHRLERLLLGPQKTVSQRMFYLTDTTPIRVSEWADMISLKTRGRKALMMPESIAFVAAKVGDFLKLCGYKEPPLSTIRLKNMKVDTSKVDLKEIDALTGHVPFTMSEGIDITLAWLRSHQYIN